MKINSLIKVVISLVIIMCNVGCDQITKEKVRKEISENQIINILGDNFILTKVENTGAAMSLGDNLSPILKIIFLQALPIIALILIFLYMVRDENISKLNLIAFSTVIGGGIGNIYDRILHNSVTDFMYFEYGILHTGVFNMADVSVTIGVLLIFLNSGIFGINKTKYSITSL